MDVTDQAKAVMLLTVSFGKSEARTAKPLTPTEWGDFADWLKDSGLSPTDLLKSDLSDLLQDWENPKVAEERLRALLRRGTALALVLEKWQRAGLWVLTRADRDYPRRLKQHLGRKAPAILFGCGEAKLLNESGIAVVGSRDADRADLDFTRCVGRRVAASGRLLVSGGARGVDQTAMLGALQAEGTAVGILADNLLRSATSATYRERLMSGELALISPFNPEARFSVANAMARNKYIYCLARHAIVVASTPDRGGTWSGAVENLRNEWVPLWIQRKESPGSGNPQLVERGGRWFEDLDDLVGPVSADGRESNEPVNDAGASRPQESIDPAQVLFAKVQDLLVELCAEPKREGEVVDALSVKQGQVRDWLSRLVENGVLARSKGRPVRYVVREPDLVTHMDTSLPKAACAESPTRSR